MSTISARRNRTMITFDNGAQWHAIEAPSIGVDGNAINCDMVRVLQHLVVYLVIDQTLQMYEHIHIDIYCTIIICVMLYISNRKQLLCCYCLIQPSCSLNLHMASSFKYRRVEIYEQDSAPGLIVANGELDTILTVSLMHRNSSYSFECN